MPNTELANLALFNDANLQWYAKYSNGADTADSSSNSNTLTHVNTPTNVSGGKFDYGMDYELSSSEYSYAVDSASISPTGDLSLGGWFNFEQLVSTAGSDMMLIAKWNFTNAKRSYRFSVNTANKLDMRISDLGTNQTTNSTSDVVVESGDLGNFIHLGMTFDASTTTFKAYLNGVSVGLAGVSGSATAIHDNNARMAIGAQDVESTAVNFFDGVGDDLYQFDRVLTDEEMLTFINGDAKPSMLLMF